MAASTPIDTILPLLKPTISPAVEQVFNTTELLECILLHLGDLERGSWKRLFPLQRVSKRFHDVIYASPALRRTMFLDAQRPALLTPSLRPKLEGYRAFFGDVSQVLQPFWCHIRPSGVEGELILAMNVSLFWTEETPGVMVGRAPETLNGPDAVAQNVSSWRRLVVPYLPAQDLDMHCIGYPLEDRLNNGVTLGEIYDRAVAASKGHLNGLKPVMHYI